MQGKTCDLVDRLIRGAYVKLFEHLTQASLCIANKQCEPDSPGDTRMPKRFGGELTWLLCSSSVLVCSSASALASASSSSCTGGANE